MAVKEVAKQEVKSLKVKTNLKAGALGDPCEPQWYAGYRDGWGNYQAQLRPQDRRPSPV